QYSRVVVAGGVSVFMHVGALCEEGSKPLGMGTDSRPCKDLQRRGGRRPGVSGLKLTHYRWTPSIDSQAPVHLGRRGYRLCWALKAAPFASLSCSSSSAICFRARRISASHSSVSS